MSVAIEAINPKSLPEPTPTFTHGLRVTGCTELLFVSGQVAWADTDGQVPRGFDRQCEQAWKNILDVLEEACMGVENLVKVTVYLSDRKYCAALGQIRDCYLGRHRPAFTCIITDIYSEHWLLEIEAVAAR